MRPIQQISVADIQVLNPRARSRAQHREIIDNIATIGLKRPITVSARQQPDGVLHYDLVCGQGRLEAYRALGIPEIPAFVISATEADCMIMSLVENVARRQHPAVEIMREIQALRERGYDDQQIADRIGTTASWVSMVAGLLEKGEERLVAAVETGLIPISMAVQISRSEDADVQRLLTDAYAEGALRGKKLGIVRRLLDQRSRRGKSERLGTLGRRDRNRRLTVEQLKRVYEREVEKQQILIKKADITQNRLMFITRCLRELRSDKQFVALLRSERIDTLPRALAERMTGPPS